MTGVLLNQRDWSVAGCTIIEPMATDSVCPKCGGTGWMETTSHRPPYRFVARCVCEPTEVHYASRETTRFWITKIRQQLDQANGPLARSLRPMLTVPQADERYFADHHDPDPVEQWYGDDPEDRS